MHRVLPAHQCLHAHRCAGFDIHLRLVIQDELILVDRAPQVCFGDRLQGGQRRHVRRQYAALDATVALQNSPQLFANERFAQAPQHAQVRSARHFAGHGQQAHLDATEQQNARATTLFAEVTQHFNAVNVRHHEINHNHIGVAGAKRLELLERGGVQAGIAERLRDGRD